MVPGGNRPGHAGGLGVSHGLTFAEEREQERIGLNPIPLAPRRPYAVAMKRWVLPRVDVEPSPSGSLTWHNPKIL